MRSRFFFFFFWYPNLIILSSFNYFSRESIVILKAYTFKRLSSRVTLHILRKRHTLHSTRILYFSTYSLNRRTILKTGSLIFVLQRVLKGMDKRKSKQSKCKKKYIREFFVFRLFFFSRSHTFYERCSFVTNVWYSWCRSICIYFV